VAVPDVGELSGSVGTVEVTSRDDGDNPMIGPIVLASPYLTFVATTLAAVRR
jgi:hypothetical protein